LGSFKRQINEGHPEKIVIVAGPTFGMAMQFMLLGAVVGAAGAVYWQSRKSGPTAASDDAVFEGLTGGGAKDTGQLVDRLTQLSSRLKSLAARTKETVQSAAEVMAPAVKQAVAEGKTVAQQTEQELQEELHRPPAEVTPGVVPGAATDGPVPGM